MTLGSKPCIKIKMVGRRFLLKILSGEVKQKEKGVPALLPLHIPQHL